MTADEEPSSRKSQKSRGLANRLARTGGTILNLVEELPDSKAGAHLRDQLLRSGTAPGAHYAEARSAQSRDDFVHKVSLAAKEAREALYWLRVAHHCDFLDSSVEPLVEELDEAVAMLFASLQTARKNAR